MENQSIYGIDIGIIILVIVLLIFSSKIWDIMWDIGKSLIYIIIIIYILNYFSPTMAEKIKQILIDLIDINPKKNIIQEISSKITEISEKTINSEMIEELNQKQNKNITNVGETNNRNLT
jgi:uncharacterized protein YacL